jgi:hypothetical protein
MYVNEIQRTINGVAYSYTVPYGHWQPYRPESARGQFGDVPNDFEASVDLQYIPVRQGWYYGAPIDGRGYPDASRQKSLGDATADVALQQLARAEKFQAVLQVISTASIAVLATLAVMRAVQARRMGVERPFLGDDE